MYLVLKHSHYVLMTLSLLLFTFRSTLKYFNIRKMEVPLLRVLPHIIDSLLIFSGVLLAFHLGYSPLKQHWLLMKLVCLCLYIYFSYLTLKKTTLPSRRIIYFLLAVSSFILVINYAITKHTFLGIWT